MNLSEQLRELSPTRRALLAAGTVTLALSMALSIAPAFAAGNGNSGSVKIHDVSTGADDPSNDPQVCSPFTIVFFGFDAGASGTWVINSQPSAAGDPVGHGTFVADANGDFETTAITIAAGHYKVEWTLAGKGKSKTLTVNDTCAPDDSGSGQATPDPSPSEPVASQPASSDPGSDGTPAASPSEPAASQPASNDPGSGTPAASPSEPVSSHPAASEGASSDPGTTGPGTTDPGDTGGTTSATPSARPSGTTGQTPESGVEATTGSGNSTATLPDTAAVPQPIGITPLLTVLGLLLIVAAHPFIRRSAHADRA